MVKILLRQKHRYLQPGVTNGIAFLVSLYKSGLVYSAIKTAHSTLSLILVLKDGVNFGEHPLVARSMKGIFELDPALPKYTEIWDDTIDKPYTSLMLTSFRKWLTGTE